MSKNDETLINLLSKHSDVVNQSLTHMKRGSRISVELTTNVLEVAKIFNENYAYMPSGEQEKLRALAQIISQLHDEFSEFFEDWGKDLICMGELMPEIFSSFKIVMNEYKEKEK